MSHPPSRPRSESGRGDALRRGLSRFTDRPSPAGWILVHSDPVFRLPKGEFAQSAMKTSTSVVRGSAATKMNVVNADDLSCSFSICY